MTDKELLALALSVVLKAEDAGWQTDGCGDVEGERCPVCDENIDVEMPLEKRGHAPGCSLLEFLKQMETRK